jgi:hypothetical protein
MKYISTTELRTKSKELVKTLRDKGEEVYLVHRSEVIGKLEPYEEKDEEGRKDFTIKDPGKFREFLDSFATGEKTAPEERDRRYRKHLEEKYGI